MNLSINFELKGAKMLEQKILMIQTRLLSVQILWMMFMRRLLVAAQTEKKSFNCV